MDLLAIADLIARIESLEVCRRRDAARIRELEKYVDTVSSPLWKRLWWSVIQGYRFRTVGRWRK